MYSLLSNLVGLGTVSYFCLIFFFFMSWQIKEAQFLFYFFLFFGTNANTMKGKWYLLGLVALLVLFFLANIGEIK